MGAGYLNLNCMGGNLCHLASSLPFQKLTFHSTGEMKSWQLRFLNGTTVTGAGMPPVLWVKQPVQEKKENVSFQDDIDVRQLQRRRNFALCESRLNLASCHKLKTFQVL